MTIIILILLFSSLSPFYVNLHSNNRFAMQFLITCFFFQISGVIKINTHFSAHQNLVKIMCDPNNATVTCVVNIQWTNIHGITIKNAKYRSATLSLVRDESRRLLLSVTAVKSAENKFLLKDMKVLNRSLSFPSITTIFC